MRKILSAAFLGVSAVPYILLQVVAKLTGKSADFLYDVRWRLHAWAYPEKYGRRERLPAPKLTEEWRERV